MKRKEGYNTACVLLVPCVGTEEYPSIFFSFCPYSQLLMLHFKVCHCAVGALAQTEHILPSSIQFVSLLSGN